MCYKPAHCEKFFNLLFLLPCLLSVFGCCSHCLSFPEVCLISYKTLYFELDFPFLINSEVVIVCSSAIGMIPLIVCSYEDLTVSFILGQSGSFLSSTETRFKPLSKMAAIFNACFSYLNKFVLAYRV